MKKSVTLLGAVAFVLLGTGPGAAIDAQSALSSISGGGSVSEVVSSSGGGSASISASNGGSGFASSGNFLLPPTTPPQSPPSQGSSDSLIMSIDDSHIALIGSIKADVESGKEGILSSFGQ